MAANYSVRRLDKLGGILIGYGFGLRLALTLASAIALTLTSGRAQTTSLDLPKFQYSRIASGLDYAHIRQPDKPWAIHVARLDRKKKQFSLATTLGQDGIQGLATVSQQVAAFPPGLGRPLAAINGDFFQIKPGPRQGDPEGIQIINGELVSAPSDQCFWVETNGNLHIGDVQSQFVLAWPNAASSPLYLNQSPPTNAVTLFTSNFGQTTRATNVMELVLEKIAENSWLPLHVGTTIRAQVCEIRPSGNTSLAPSRMVLAVTGDASTNIPIAQPGAELRLSTATSRDLSLARTAIGGRPLLVRNGQEQNWSVKTGAIENKSPRHPRTAVGFNRRYLFLVVVDGRQQELSIGMTFAELAALMKQLGCTEALNLDGGGSSTFWLGGRVMNSPSDQHERPLANALLIVRKPK